MTVYERNARRALLAHAKASAARPEVTRTPAWVWVVWVGMLASFGWIIGPVVF